jgi:hypothetical protein
LSGFQCFELDCHGIVPLMLIYRLSVRIRLKIGGKRTS